MATNNELLKSLDSTRPNWSFFDDWWKSLDELNPIKKVIKTLGAFQKKEKKNELQTSSSFYERFGTKISVQDWCSTGMAGLSVSIVWRSHVTVTLEDLWGDLVDKNHWGCCWVWIVFDRGLVAFIQRFWPQPL